MDYFEFYGLNPSFYLDEKKLKQLYYQKMRDLHPDMHVGSSNESQNEVLTLSSYNNEAYNTLKDFHLRLNYLVDLFGESSSKKEMPKMFLMEMMDVNEEIMDLQMDFDASKAASIESNILIQQSEILDELDAILKINPNPKEASVQVFNEISAYLLKRNYFKRLFENISHLKP